MQPQGVVEADDVVVDVGNGFVVIDIDALPGTLHLQVQEEAFHDRVIPAVALAAHAGHQLVPGQQVTVGLTDVWATSVGMHDQSGLGLAQRNGTICKAPCP